MTGTADRYRRLLRWYPRRWREADRGVLLDTLIEDAIASGRELPTVGETLSAAVHGSAERFDRRTAITAAAAMIPVGIIAGALDARAQDVVASPIAMTVSAPLLAVVAVCLLRHRGLIGSAASVLLPPLAFVAGAAGATALILWGLEFDAADAGAPQPAWWQPTQLAPFATAWTTATATVAVGVAAAFRLTGLPKLVRAAAAVLVAIVAAPPLGMMLSQVGGAAVIGTGALVAALLVGRAVERDAGRRAAVTRAPHDRAAFRLAVVGGSVALAGVAVAAAGGPVTGLDGTTAMAVGLGIGAAGGIPVLLAAARTWRFARAATPLAVAGLVVNAAIRCLGPFPEGDGQLAALAASGALLAAAFATVVRPALPGSPALRAVLSVLIGLGVLLTSGVPLAAVLGFAVPFAAVGVALANRRPRAAAVPTPLPDAR